MYLIGRKIARKNGKLADGCAESIEGQIQRRHIRLSVHCLMACIV
jgi:hypothetical protein